MKNVIRKSIGAILLVLVFSAAFYPPLQQYLETPHHLVFFEGQEYDVPTSLPALANTDNDSISVFQENGQTVLKGNKASDTSLNFGLGNFPLKSMKVTVLPELKVIPGGQSIGVRVQTDGVLVVGHHLVDTDEGSLSPGENAGIEVGDTITKMNGIKIEQMNDLNPVVQDSGEAREPIKVEIKRDGEFFEKELMPVKGKGEESFRLGLYIRDSAAGVGTLTFYEPNSKKYGALGHVISDMDTRQPIEVNEGEIVSSKVTSIEKGMTGEPGEKLARFASDRKVLGDIQKNSPYGIFGTLHESLENGKVNKPMDIGLSHQVEEGPAEILTVVEGDEIKRFDIEIVSSTEQKYPATKGMVIKVTDPELIEATGGIVQGMSGSPIIQNDRIIGAVTHVFVNDPTSGYGCHIEWMLQEAGIDIYEKMEEAS
ncbi:SpoIVB peptidase [Evansella cellulosilytica]|uniref:Stage IV sporulation protein B n=1 Tax=Evansella cellulosilytica (strain ATCC 21833 / DSM 2522 / FERM P-1141 / JCM 9156 / N-4) TaxID=649639 RepID=E6TXR0_EVAC2|nr:SpoIVB peptidase [Evansella cellulosilytica]ADU29986.1 stage IV sporulation protein B [Evansella cellulosilytica DSM 2522]